MKTFKQMRGITDKQLAETLNLHDAYIRGLVAFANRTLKERRLGIGWVVVVTAAVVYLLVTR